MPTLTDRTFATGKRKTAVARVILRPGTGNILVNNRPYDQYFPRPASQLLILQPFEIVEVIGRYDVVANVAGGGLAAQADAVRFGIARALTGGENSERRTPLKRAGLLTRDARKKERKKYGQPGARKRFQYSKR